jgi:hypothetical protein
MAIDALLAGLIDYAGLYPPASLDMRSAVENYRGYRQGPHAAALGRFVVGLDRLEELRGAAGDSLAAMRLSVILPADADFTPLAQYPAQGSGFASYESRVSRPAEIEQICVPLPAGSECYFEIPMGKDSEELIDAVAAHRARVKLRMGGVTADAFPSPKMVALILHRLVQRQVSFKATAGLHHPIRSRHPFTYKAESPAGMMHGFLNLALAATLLHFGGTVGEALKTLEENDPGAWRISRDLVRCRAFAWSADQIREVRERFFISFGSCSFDEPIRDLEALGWL